MQKQITFTLNGRKVKATVQPHHTLLLVLREQFALEGGRASCGQGLCGSCTLLVNGRPVSGCLYLAAFADGAEVLTIEGLSDGDQLHPVQEAFLENYGFQCGFCTPGMILSTVALLKQNPNPTRQQIQEYLSGNICRCAAYEDIIKSVQAAAAKLAAVR